MSKIEEMLKEQCPNGVEYIKLGELCFIKARIGWQRLTKNEYLEKGEYYLVTGVDIRPNHRVDFSSCYYVSKERYEMDTNIQLQNGDIIVTKDGTIGKVALIENMDKPAVLNSHLFVIRDISGKLNNRFLMHVLLSNYFKKFIAKRSTSGTISGLNQSVMVEFPIPVPPIEVQAEIVKILDEYTESVTALQQELEKELTARKKQYEYYRDLLLDFNVHGGGASECEWRTLGEITTIIRGGNFQKKDFVEKGKPCIHYGQMYTHFGVSTTETLTYVSEATFKKSKTAAKNDIIMAVTSENVDDVCKCVAWLGNEDIAVSGHTAIIKHNQNAKYLSYYFHTSHFFAQKRKLAHGTKVIEVTPDKLNNISIPIPSIAEQERIVSILDRFDKLCNDISEGLPAEIEARRKQYEYYRDKLLSFKSVNGD